MHWHSDLAAARAEAETSGRLLLHFFWAPG
jgi:hypothetical protein